MLNRIHRPRQGPCASCGVMTPKRNRNSRCRCCVADEDPFDETIGADTGSSAELLPPPPEWPKGIGRFPRAETYLGARGFIAALWWMPRGHRWVPQHPLEYPRDRLSGLV